MKVVPILVVTNALALGLAILLYFQQEDLQSQMGSARSVPVRQAEAPVDTGELYERLARLESRFASPGTPPAPAPGAAGEKPSGKAETEPDAAKNTPKNASPDDLDRLAISGMTPQAMELFRRRVRRAQELNSAEDRFRRVEERIDRLVQSNRIAPLSPKQKKAVAKTLNDTRRAIPNIWRKIRENNDLGSMSREERGQVIRNEYEGLRVEAQKALEQTIPAADAKTILDDSMRNRGFGGFGGFGTRSRSRRSGRRAGN